MAVAITLTGPAGDVQVAGARDSVRPAPLRVDLHADQSVGQQDLLAYLWWSHGAVEEFP
jgi:hypothetical protein